jgi:hypothetical protein
VLLFKAAAPRLTLTAPRRKGQLLDRRPDGSSHLCLRWAGGVSAGIGGSAQDGAVAPQ